MEINDLEAKWEQQFEGEDEDGTDGGKMHRKEPVHMELFYNVDREQEEEYGDDVVYDVNGIGNVGHGC